METELEHPTDDINPVKKTKDWIKENTIWICLLCFLNLIFMGPRFIISWANVGGTMIQEGVAGVLRVFYWFWYSSRISGECTIWKG